MTTKYNTIIPGIKPDLETFNWQWTSSGWLDSEESELPVKSSTVSDHATVAAVNGIRVPKKPILLLAVIFVLANNGLWPLY